MASNLSFRTIKH